MQFTTFTLSALSIASALAASQVTVHVVQVGNKNGTLAYTPDNVVAAVGDFVQFQFAPANHTVTQSTFDNPCQPIALHSNVTGIYSGFMPVPLTAETTPTYTIMINNTTPMWIYCSQGKHCQAGMTMVINQNTAANATRSLANFKAAAALQTVNLPGNAVSNGTTGTSNTPESSLGASGAASTATSTSSSSTTSATAGSSASAIKVSGSLAMGGLLAAIMVLFV